jgi:hypothetical protein
MVALQVFLTEPLDSARLADVQVRAVATVVASIRLPQFDEPPRLPAGGVFSLDQPAIMYSAPITAGRAGIALPQQTALTGADGSAEFVWDESPGSPARIAWDDLGPLVAAGGSRFFRFSAGASLGGVVLPIIDLPGTADTGEAIAQFVGVDLATAIVGHVTDSSARLWFRFHPMFFLPDTRFIAARDWRLHPAAWRRWRSSLSRSPTTGRGRESLTSLALPATVLTHTTCSCAHHQGSSGV